MPSHPLVFRSISILLFIKVKFTVEEAKKAQRGSRCILFLQPRRYMGVGGQCHAPAGKTRYPFYRRLGGSQGRSERVRKVSPPPGFDPRTVQSVFLLSGDFPSGVPTTILYTVLLFAILATCPAYLISHDFITAGVYTCGPEEVRIQLTATVNLKQQRTANVYVTININVHYMQAHKDGSCLSGNGVRLH